MVFTAWKEDVAGQFGVAREDGAYDGGTVVPAEIAGRRLRLRGAAREPSCSLPMTSLHLTPHTARMQTSSSSQGLLVDG